MEGIDAHEGVTEALDYEGELAVVIGKTGKTSQKLKRSTMCSAIRSLTM